MSTIKFGSSVGPSGILGSSYDCREQEEAKPVDDADPDAMMQCPYDKSHQIRACRFPFHILKCAKNNPKLARELKTCPFNAKHLLPSHELAHHTEHCKDKPVSTLENEVDDNAATFVWGVTNKPLPENKPEPPATNNFTRVRAPRSFPWKSCELFDTSLIFAQLSFIVINIIIIIISSSSSSIGSCLQ
ncbi:Gametocyte-specific factor 1 [Bagarius yarrelli]|uniref:Gametocyte-specific factor 1 n=1 Tax=Bagarius yarrelli TaxID=175774 RepID=A0A556VTW7_BAGYA|nr:Gametocyte-specific factor 1 [Bagarius yarrelli]